MGVEYYYIFSGPVVVVFDHRDNSSVIVGELDEFDLILIFFEIDLHFELKQLLVHIIDVGSPARDDYQGYFIDA